MKFIGNMFAKIMDKMLAMKGKRGYRNVCEKPTKKQISVKFVSMVSKTKDDI